MIDIGISLTAERQAQLQRELKDNNRANVYRRAAALLAIHKGRSVIQVAELLGVTRQSIYNWIAAYGNTNETLDLKDGRRSGRPSVWTAELQACLGRALNDSPDRLGYAARHWTVSLLRERLASDSGSLISEATLRRKLKLMGYAQKRHRYVIRTPQAEVQGLILGVVTRPFAVEEQNERLEA